LINDLESRMAMLNARGGAVLLTLLPLSTLPLAGCQDSTVTVPSPQSYTVGGSITGLNSPGLILGDSATHLSVASGASSFTLPEHLPPGYGYSVKVVTQPSGLTCTVGQGSGTMSTADVADVTVSCVQRAWTWMSGPSDTPNVAGVYGVKGTPAPGNMPGARNEPVSWTDSAGNLWLYGGYAFNATGSQGVTDDLWKYSPATNEWTWMGGSDTDFNVAATYGTRGLAAPTNEPGVRENATSWSDGAGNLWLFGGDGLSQGFNDLWKYSTASNQWTWVSGSNSGNANGVYGTQGVADPSNVPGARAQALGWADKAGNFWVFGGTDANGNALNDLWKFSPVTGQWTWMSGSNTPGAAGVYGTEGSADPANVPGARFTATSWVDAAGSLWLFGGIGFDGAGGFSVLNDLWKYDPASNQWTWMSGSIAANANGTYGMQGTADAANTPGSRNLPVAWTDSAGNLWLFGGYGRDGGGGVGQLNDLWKYDPTLNQWTWVDGSSSVYAVSVYGTQGVAAPGNEPGSLQYMVSFTDAMGNFWMFGGYGNAADTSGSLNVLWRY
jgi:N-acetylneuraminic acid mutarotase